MFIDMKLADAKKSFPAKKMKKGRIIIFVNI
jgi:hypothetical protein